MEFTKYLENIEEKLQGCFDLEKNFNYKGMEFELSAKYFMKSERYILTKKAKIFGIENNEYCLLKHYTQLDKSKLEAFIDALKSATIDFVTPHEEHMSSIITGILVVDQSCEKDFINIVKKLKYQKSFAFGLKGWADIRLILVMLDTGEVITNKKGREVKEVYKVS